MITVMELLSYPVFQNFKLISDPKGLLNEVSGTGIFEWETEEDIKETFRPGEFVMTTLSAAKDDLARAEESLKPLIRKHVCAISIKTVYYQHVSKEFLDFANQHHVPIFLFSDTYFDDLIFTVKNALLTDDLNATLVEKVSLLTHFEGDEEETKQLAKKINPFFHSNLICCTCCPQPQEKTAAIMSRLRSRNANISKTDLTDPEKDCCSLVWYEKRVLILYTTESGCDALRDKVLSFIEKWSGSLKLFKLGFSEAKESLALLGTAIRESFYASVSCCIDKEDRLEFNQIGLDQWLIPLRNNFWITNQYERFYSILVQYDEEHKTNLLETLIQYIKSNGDVILTAKTLYQHANTIRYRLGKIKKLLGISDSMDSYFQLYYFIRLYEIHRLLGED